MFGGVGSDLQWGEEGRKSRKGWGEGWLYLCVLACLGLCVGRAGLWQDQQQSYLAAAPSSSNNKPERGLDDQTRTKAR